MFYGARRAFLHNNQLIIFLWRFQNCLKIFCRSKNEQLMTQIKLKRFSFFPLFCDNLSLIDWRKSTTFLFLEQMSWKLVHSSSIYPFRSSLNIRTIGWRKQVLLMVNMKHLFLAIIIYFSKKVLFWPYFIILTCFVC